MISTEADVDLVGAWLRGDVSAFENLMHRYERAVYNLAYRLVGDREDAKDIVQSAFLKAYQGLKSFDPSREFRSWLYRIAINESINFRRGRKHLEPLDLVEAGRPAIGNNPEEDSAKSELRRDVQEALMGMKREHRVVIVLRHFLECSYEEIGQIIQKPEKTVKSRLFEARHILKDSLVQRGVR